MKKPKRQTKEMVLCVECKKPIHLDDLGMISKEGLWHQECLFRIARLNPERFIIGYEALIRKKVKNG